MDICLLSLKWCKFGGWPTYTWHMKRALEAQGHTVDCLSMESPTGSTAWAEKIKDVERLKSYDIVHIVVAVTKDRELLDWLTENLKGKIVITLHDPTEFKLMVKRFVAKTEAHCFFIRKGLTKSAYSTFAKYKEYIPHPYERESDGVIGGTEIVCTSRIDFDKNTEMILKADCGIKLHTGHINRMYDYHNGLGVKDHPDYCGGFEFGKVGDVLKNAAALVDMSSISGDGGGTQYTFLEAMDYGLTLILHADWITGPNDEMKPTRHYIAVHNHEELSKAVNRVRKNAKAGNIDNRKKYRGILREHNHAVVGKQYTESYTKWIAGVKKVKPSGIHRFI